MSHFRLLHLIDGTATYTAFIPQADFKLPVFGGISGLTKELDKLLSKGHTFGSAIITTHGKPGQIEFDGEVISRYGSTINSTHSGLFPFGGKVYFNGCNVGANEEGTGFVRYMGRVLLQHVGGIVSANTRKGVWMDDLMVGIMMAGSGIKIASVLRGHVLSLGNFGSLGGIKHAAVLPGGSGSYIWED